MRYFYSSQVTQTANKYEYFVIQTKILDELILFLKNTHEVLTTKEHRLRQLPWI